MNEFLSWMARAGKFIWQRTAALVAVLLIIAALIIGYRLGRPAGVRASSSARAPADGWRTPSPRSIAARRFASCPPGSAR